MLVGKVAAPVALSCRAACACPCTNRNALAPQVGVLENTRRTLPPSGDRQQSVGSRRFSTSRAAGNGASPGGGGLKVDLTGLDYKTVFCKANLAIRLKKPWRSKREADQSDQHIIWKQSGGAGKKAFIAGVADDQGFGWAIAKALAEAGAEISLGVWVPALNIFESSLRRGKFDDSRKLSDGSLLEFKHILPMDAVFDSPDDVPEEISSNKRYSAAAGKGFTVMECAKNVKDAVGSIDVLVHSLANGPEVAKPLLETSRKGYLAALSASSYSYVSMLQHFGAIMSPGGAALSLTYVASERIIPGYGGGMSSAKAALESDTKVLAFEAGRKYGVRVNTISAGPLGSRAAKAIGFIDDMIRYSHANAPIQKELEAREVGNVAAFLLSPLATAITGSVVYVDNGLHAMGLALDSKSFVPEGDKVAA